MTEIIVTVLDSPIGPVAIYSESDTGFTSYVQMETTTVDNKKIAIQVSRIKVLNTASKTTYYYNIRTTEAGTD